MDPSAWIALAALAFAILAQGLVVAFSMGGMFARMKTLEARPTDSDCKQELAVLTTRFEGMEKTLSEVAHDLKNLLTGKLTPARRTRAPGP